MAICYTRKCCDGDLYVIANEMPAMIILLHIIYLVMSVSCNNLCVSDQRLPLVFLDFLPPLVISPKVSCTSSIQSYVDCSHKMLLFYGITLSLYLRSYCIETHLIITNGALRLETETILFL